MIYHELQPMRFLLVRTFLQGEHHMFEQTKQLYIELSSLEDRGVTIWLEGSPSDSFGVTSQLNIHEENEYMRDYVFEEGRLKEVHFDKVVTPGD